MSTTTLKFNIPKFLGIILLLITTLSAFSQTKTLQNGDKISFDGSYYDFRDSAGVKMIKMWIPTGTKIIRGVFISGHGGGGGDSRDFARDQNIRAYAVRLGFAVAGLHNFPGNAVYDKSAKVFFNALNEFSKIGNHPEIANLPFVVYGSSNGGNTAYGLVNYAPQRAICFVSNVGPGGNPKIPVDEALRVPGIIIIGKFDALMGQRAIDRAIELIAHARPKKALWTWALELKGHEDGYSFDYYMKFVEQAVALRYPVNSNPTNMLVKLNEIKEESGWLTDLNTWDKGLTQIAPYNDYKGDKQKAGWLLNQDMAYIYRSLATHHNPFSISVKEFDRTYNPNTNPGTMFSLGGPVASPGETITIQCSMELIPDWQKIEFFNGSKKLGEVLSGSKPEIIIPLDGLNLVYCLTALATDKSGNQFTCNPLHFFIKDPKRTWEDSKATKRFPFIKRNAGSKNSGKKIDCFRANPTDSILVAYGLTAEMEKQFSSMDNKVSDFWNLIDEKKDFIDQTAKKNATQGANFNGVLTHDCNMKVKAAYGSDGLYLLFEVNDDNDVAYPNSFTGTENEQFYLNFDVIDILIDNRTPENIGKPENADLRVSRENGLSLTTRQYQVACGTKKEPVKGFKRSFAEPWDFNSTFYTFDEARMQLGLEIENVKIDFYNKAQEVFIPWSEYGAGFASEPEALTRMSFTAGYNDRDEGEHFPPGKSSSGSFVNASNSIRWIDKKDPWSVSKFPFSWGEIELGDMLK